MVQVSCLNRFSLFRAFVVFLVLWIGLQGCGGGGSSSSTMYDLTIDNPTISEGNTGDTNANVLTFTVSLSEPVDTVVTVSYTTVDNTATAGEDYTARTDTLTIPKNTGSAEITIDITADDDFEANETLTVQLSNPQGVKVSSSSLSLTAIGTITNDDNASKGYFTGSGTLGGVLHSDMVALAYTDQNAATPEGRILLFSPEVNVLYDIDMDMTSYDGTIYSGNVVVYVNGVRDQALSITGQTSGINLTGSFSDGTGSGFGEGSFEVVYDLDNNEGAGVSASDYSRIETVNSEQWYGDLHSVDTVIGSFRFDHDGGWGGGNENVPACVFTGDEQATIQASAEIPLTEINVFKLSNYVIQSSNCGYVGSNFTGFASVINITGTDDGLMFAETDGTYAVFSVMVLEP